MFKFILVIFAALLLIAATPPGIPQGFLDRPDIELVDADAFEDLFEDGDMSIFIQFRLDRDNENTTGAACNIEGSTTLSAAEASGQTILSVDSISIFDTANGFSALPVTVIIQDASGLVDDAYRNVSAFSDTNTTITIITALTADFASGSDVIISPFTKEGDGDFDCYNPNFATLELQDSSGNIVDIGGLPQVKSPPRIGPGVAAFYFTSAQMAANPIAWNDGSQIFLRESVTAFDDPRTTGPIAIDYHTEATNQAEAIAAFENTMIEYLTFIQTQYPSLFSSGSLVDEGVAQAAGLQMFLEALPLLSGPLSSRASTSREILQNVYSNPGVSDLTANAAAAQADVTVEDATLFGAGMTVALVDDNASENLTVLSIDSTTNVVTMTTNLVNAYTTAADAFLSKTLGDIQGVTNANSMFDDMSFVTQFGGIAAFVLALGIGGMVLGTSGALAFGGAIAVILGFAGQAGIIEIGYLGLLAFAILTIPIIVFVSRRT